MNSKSTSLLKIWGLNIVLTAGTWATSGSEVFAQASSERWSAADIIKKLNSEDKDWQTRVFKNLYLKDGKVIDNRGTTGSDRDDVEVLEAEVMVRTVNGRQVYDLGQMTYVPSIQRGLIEIKSMADGGILYFDPATRMFYYKAPGQTQAVLFDGSLLSKYPDLRAQLEAMGFTFQTGAGGVIQILAPNGLPGIQSGTVILVPGTGSGYPNNPGTILIPGTPGYPPTNTQTGSGLPGTAILGPGTIFGPGGTIISTGGAGSYNLIGGGGSAVVISSRADIVDPKKTESYYEFDALGQKYMIASMVIPEQHWFDWFNDEEVLVRNAGDIDGNGDTDWVLISQQEHEFLMRALNADAEANKKTLSEMKYYKVDKFDSSDYENVRKFAMKHKDAGQAGTISISNMPSGTYGGVILGGGGAAGAQDTLIAFINDYRSKNPNASIADLQAALDARFGAGLVQLNQGADGNLSITILNAGGANGAAGSQVIVLNPSGQIVSGGQTQMIYPYPLSHSMNPVSTPISSTFVPATPAVKAESGELSDSFKAQMEALQSKKSATSGGSSSSQSSDGSSSSSSSTTTTTVTTGGSAGTPSVNGGSSTSTVTTISTLGQPTLVIGRDGVARIQIPIHLGEGVYRYEMYTLTPEEFARLQKNSDGSITITDSALIDKINQIYGVKLNVLTTAPGASSTTTVTTGGNNPSSPRSLHFEAQNDAQLVKVVEELQKVYGDLKIYVTEIGGTIENSQGSTVATYTKKIPKVSYDEFAKKNLLDGKE